jgi:hypothetical protein
MHTPNFVTAPATTIIIIIIIIIISIKKYDGF